MRTAFDLNETQAGFGASPAKAGAQSRSARNWAPAFAGEAFCFVCGGLTQ